MALFKPLKWLPAIWSHILDMTKLEAWNIPDTVAAKLGAWSLPNTVAAALKDRAIADFNAALTINPNYAEAYNNRGNAYADKGDYDRAITSEEPP